MARLPHTIIYKFYGAGIPKNRAIKLLTLRLGSQHCHVKDRNLIMTFTGRKQRHPGVLLFHLICAIHRFCSAKSSWLGTLEEIEAM